MPHPTRLLAALLVGILFAIAPAQTARAQAAPRWTLVWQDEFGGPAGAPPDPRF